jgi:S-adenosylmethionine:tRNA ribosyltransferase-isomerase
MRPEYYHISVAAARAINNAVDQDCQIIAVGTTTVKTLESAACNGFIKPGSAWSDLFIYPGYTFRSPISGMLTNFHLPQSTPLLLTCAFAGKAVVLDAYQEALRCGYRFLSFGDAMLILERMHV